LLERLGVGVTRACSANVFSWRYCGMRPKGGRIYHLNHVLGVGEVCGRVVDQAADLKLKLGASVGVRA
jgi:hypothetical protein